jgi:hypothetical protein
MTREPIYEALFALLSAIPGLVTTSRRLQHWSKVEPASQPALFQAEGPENQVPRKGFPAKVTLRCDVYLYVNTGNDMSVVPGPIINPLMDAIEAALAPNPATGFQTLGGTVSHCWIEGEITTDEGVLGPQAIKIIPVFILINN